MKPAEENILITSEDLKMLNRAGLDKDDIALMLHELARNIQQERTSSLNCTSGLTSSEIQILREGGSQGLPNEEVGINLAVEILSLAQQQVELNQLHQTSLCTKDVANLLSVTPARVRQLSVLSNRALYFYAGASDDAPLSNLAVRRQQSYPASPTGAQGLEHRCTPGHSFTVYVSGES